MSTQVPPEEERDRFREFSAEDIGGTRPEFSDRDSFTEESPIGRDRTTEIPESIREAAREKGIAEAIREEYGGQGLVAIDKRTGEVIDIFSDLQELRNSFESLSIPPEDRLVVSCYE